MRKSSVRKKISRFLLILVAGPVGWQADEAGIILSRVFIQQRGKHKSWRLLELQPGNNGTNYYTNSSTIDIVEKRTSR